MIPLCSPQEAKLPTSIALGSFDGLHSGHRRVIKGIKRNGPEIATVVSFWPHPREILYGEPRLRLDLPSEKAHLLEPLGIKQLVLVPFNRELASLSAETFINKVLIETLDARQISIGENFKFGKDREGDALTLTRIADKKGVDVTIVPILKDDYGRVSSSRIRSALNAGDINNAEALLGRPYNFRGVVVKGKGLGKKIGWPTANLQVNGRKFLPGLGVYAAWAWINKKDKAFPAVMNLGPQPTFDPNSLSAVEVHLLAQQIDLLGEELIIQPVKRLRGQERFDDFEKLSQQISSDALQARLLLRTN